MSVGIKEYIRCEIMDTIYLIPFNNSQLLQNVFRALPDLFRSYEYADHVFVLFQNETDRNVKIL
jgi:hypothetical protein